MRSVNVLLTYLLTYLVIDYAARSTVT